MALAAAFAVGALAVSPQEAAAAGKKVVVIVGPAGSATSNYIYNAKKLASQARSYGATVVEIYSPNATWSKVKHHAQGAHVLIYLGHGNGWPSPYAPYQSYTKNGLGLNASAGNGHHNVKYYGEYYIGRDIRLAKPAVVILNRLCYASGNSEPGHSDPTRSVAAKRVDNYFAGFHRAGARAVFAEGHGSAGFVLSGLFKSNKTMKEIFWTASQATRSYWFGFFSSKVDGAQAVMDPTAPGRYFRSLIGSTWWKASHFRSG